MSHVFSAQQDPGAVRLSVDEAKQLIREHQNRDADLSGAVTVQDMVETLGLPTWQVGQMLDSLRSQQKTPPALASGVQPMSSRDWLRTRLWVWVLAAVMVLGLKATADQFFGGVGNLVRGAAGRDRTKTDGIYDHDKVVQGRALGMQAPAGFSFEIKYDNLDAAVNGHSDHYIRAEKLSPDDLTIVQKEYTDDIVDGLSKAVAKIPPTWVDGEAVGVIRPNYYPAGLADPFDVTLHQNSFPYDPNSAAGKQLHDEVLKDIQDHWKDITD